MSGIFGLVRFDGAPVGDALATMRAAMPRWGPDGFGEWCDGPAALAQARRFSLPESRVERLPAVDDEAGFAFTAAGRLDNRDALVTELRLPDHGRGVGDGEVMMAAYRRWGMQAPRRLLGDWSFAAWHPAQRRLFLARDQLGQTALYYHCDATVAAFSSSLRAVLALGVTPVALDELYLAQYLISWRAYHGERTPSSAVRRLPPAHVLDVTPERVTSNCYWRLEDHAEIRRPGRAEYVMGLREAFDEAVRSRLRGTGPVSVTLSGGLDSSAVAATAAPMLRERGQTLTAFTSVPVGAARDDRSRFGDELPLVRAIAQFTDNIEVVAVPASATSPIKGIRWGLAVYGQPVHGASNMFWMLDLHRQVRAAGSAVLLTGALGNGGISWAGDPLSQPLPAQLRTLGVRRWLLDRGRRVAPAAVWREWSRRHLDPEWYRASAIAPEFAWRLGLAERRVADPAMRNRTARDLRLSIINPGRSLLGSGGAALGGWFGLDVRDPTADVRVLEFSLSVPEAVFRGPGDGTPRWLIREAMRGRVPDQVRLNRRKGLQAADLVTRLRTCAGEVDEALEELAAGASASYVDVGHMREAWEKIQREDTVETHRMAVSVLTRGIMGGLFANAITRGELPGSAAVDPYVESA